MTVAKVIMMNSDRFPLFIKQSLQYIHFYIYVNLWTVRQTLAVVLYHIAVLPAVHRINGWYIFRGYIKLMWGNQMTKKNFKRKRRQRMGAGLETIEHEFERPLPDRNYQNAASINMMAEMLFWRRPLPECQFTIYDSPGYKHIVTFGMTELLCRWGVLWRRMEWVRKVGLWDTTA